MDLFNTLGSAIGGTMLDRNDEVIENPWEHDAKAREYLIEVRFYCDAVDNDDALEQVRAAIKGLEFDVELVMDISE